MMLREVMIAAAKAGVPLIEAINKLPVPDAWRFMGWLEDPLAWAGRLAKGTGRRTDLERKRNAG